MTPLRAPTVDWPAAGRWAAAVVPAGPTPSAAEAAEVVATLRDAAERAYPVARSASGLEAALEAPGAVREPARVLVVDRAGWSRAAAASFAALAADRRMPGTTAQAGAILALLATRVLGQYDPYSAAADADADAAADAGRPGRLLLVAPNVLASERAMGVPPADFRLWVCVHEQTHALQFAAAPWLAGFVRAELAALLDEVEHTPPAQEVGQVLLGLLRALRGEVGRDWSLLDALPAGQRERVERMTAAMSLLEGHADVTMDAASRAIPQVDTLRRRMEARRSSTAVGDRLLRRLLGLDAKLAQYRNGAAFVREVRRLGGPDALDAAWTGPEHLPRPGEIADARAWLRRVA